MKPPSGGLVAAIRAGSLAETAGIEPGDAIVSIDGRVLRDVIDYQFHQAEPEITVRIRKANGFDDVVTFEKAIDEDLGIEFERPTWDDILLCNNNCFFCFLKGLPKGMRKTLYIKDDDYRLSFLHGNFVTLTNLEEEDWQRLREQRLSPLNVSVHATELDLRRRMLGNPSAPDVLIQIRRLGELGIEVHTQIVLCPGVNDGPHLDRSLADLVALHPAVRTVSVVPVGASPKLEARAAERDGISLHRPTPAYARTIIGQVGRAQRAARARTGKTIVHCSDEFYVTAGVRVPGAAAYDGYPQYENGIGMVRVMLQDWQGTKRRLRHRGQRFDGRRVAMACGTLIEPVLRRIACEFSALTGARVDVRAVPNRVFGERVNVSGLVCGADFADALEGVEADVAVLPRTSLDYFGRQFLDSMSVTELRERVAVPVAFASQWSEVVEILKAGAREPGRQVAPNGAMWAEPAVAGGTARITDR
ncbi:MAG: DUF512 domain-containing protein [Dehalococcoidia bacterium]